MSSTCRYCNKRSPECHSTCGDYEEYRRQKDLELAERNLDATSGTYVARHEAIRRSDNHRERGYYRKRRVSGR